MYENRYLTFKELVNVVSIPVNNVLIFKKVQGLFKKYHECCVF